MKYIVRFNTLPIGIYNVISNNCVEYAVDKDQLRKLEKEGIELNPMLKKDFTEKLFLSLITEFLIVKDLKMSQ